MEQLSLFPSFAFPRIKVLCMNEKDTGIHGHVGTKYRGVSMQEVCV